MKAIEIRKKEKKELENDLQSLKERLSGVRFKLATNKVKNVREIRAIKKDIARILTINKEAIKYSPLSKN
jgi:large subunit ribosomal protein L29